MATRVVEPEEALALVRQLLKELSPGDRVMVSEYENALVIQPEGAIDPDMMARVREVSERYRTVFEHLADS